VLGSYPTVAEGTSWSSKADPEVWYIKKKMCLTLKEGLVVCLLREVSQFWNLRVGQLIPKNKNSQFWNSKAGQADQRKTKELYWTTMAGNVA
jgi:hypothetical protein